MGRKMKMKFRKKFLKLREKMDEINLRLQQSLNISNTTMDISMEYIEDLVHKEDLGNIELLIQYYHDKEEMLILLMDAAFIFKKLEVIKYLYLKHDKHSVTEEIKNKIMNEYPQEFIEEIKMLLLELKLTKITV
jgi:hypothetical protein